MEDVLDRRAPTRKAHPTEIWAQLDLCMADQARVRAFLIDRIGVPTACVVRRMHLTVYHARRCLPGIRAGFEAVLLAIPAASTRFMVMAPGGENARPELIPADRKIGIRVQRRDPAFQQILAFRTRLISLETPSVLGSRRPSTKSRNAFGARVFQPHMTLLLPGSGVGSDLTTIGNAFRAAFDLLTFDRFVVRLTSFSSPGSGMRPTVL